MPSHRLQPAPEVPTRGLIISAWLLGLLLTVPAWSATGVLRGTVTDSEERPLANTEVTVTSDELSSFREVMTTDEEGEFIVRIRFTQYIYKFLFEKPGYRSLVEEVKPTATRQQRKTFVLEQSEVQQIEQHGDLQSVVSGSTSAAVEAFNAGLTAQKERQLDVAKTKFQEAVEADPTLGPAHIALAQVQLDLKEYEAALASADQALASKVAPVEALRVKFQALRSLGRTEEADAIAGQLSSAEDQAVAARGLYNDGAKAFQAQDFETALAKFHKAAESDPTLQDAHHAIATLQLAQGNYQAAADAAQRALDLGTDDKRTLRVLYDAYNALGRIDELLEIAPRLAAVDPGFVGPELVEQATHLWNAGQADKSVEVSKLALSIDPDLAKPHFFIGLAHLSAGENVEAKAALQQFIAMAPDDPEAQSAREMLAYIE